jgi:hypothetical protein
MRMCACRLGTDAVPTRVGTPALLHLAPFLPRRDATRARGCAFASLSARDTPARAVVRAESGVNTHKKTGSCRGCFTEARLLLCIYMVFK